MAISVNGSAGPGLHDPDDFSGGDPPGGLAPAQRETPQERIDRIDQSLPPEVRGSSSSVHPTYDPNLSPVLRGQTTSTSSHPAPGNPSMVQEDGVDIHIGPAGLDGRPDSEVATTLRHEHEHASRMMDGTQPDYERGPATIQLNKKTDQLFTPTEVMFEAGMRYRDADFRAKQGDPDWNDTSRREGDKALDKVREAVDKREETPVDDDGSLPIVGSEADPIQTASTQSSSDSDKPNSPFADLVDASKDYKISQADKDFIDYDGHQDSTAAKGPNFDIS